MNLSWGEGSDKSSSNGGVDCAWANTINLTETADYQIQIVSIRIHLSTGDNSICHAFVIRFRGAREIRSKIGHYAKNMNAIQIIRIYYLNLSYVVLGLCCNGDLGLDLF